MWGLFLNSVFLIYTSTSGTPRDRSSVSDPVKRWPWIFHGDLTRKKPCFSISHDIYIHHIITYLNLPISYIYVYIYTCVDRKREREREIPPTHTHTHVYIYIYIIRMIVRLEASEHLEELSKEMASAKAMERNPR